MELFKIEFDPSHKKYTTETLSERLKILRQLKEYAIQGYVPQYDTDTYNTILSYTPISIDKNGIQVPVGVDKEHKQIYTMKITTEIGGSLFIVYGDCFFECVDMLIKPILENLQTNCEDD